MTKAHNSNQLYFDPVCGMKVDPGKNRIMFTHQMRSYYFCAESCRQAFAENPEKYSGVNPPKRKGWWKRYLKRLNKSTGGKPPDCCH